MSPARWSVVLCGAALLTGCTPRNRDFEVQEIRETTAPGPRLGAHGAERFESDPARAPRPTEPAAGSGGLVWTAPSTWTALPAGEFRLALFRVDASVQAWISELDGDGGGVAANLARWCDQYGLDPIDAGAIATLPRIDVLGQPALFVDLTGPDGARGMLGVICELGMRTVFVKMDGPSESVRARADVFRAFCTSLGTEE